LQHPKVLVIASDYGGLSRKLDSLKRLLREWKIAYHVLEVESWLDCASITAHHRTEAENEAIFFTCCAKNMLTLSQGRLFRCPYAANAARLRAVPDWPDDYVDIMAEVGNASEVNKNLSVVRRWLMDYLVRKIFLKTCDFCNGRPLSGPTIEPAVQADEPLAYRILTH
jgi:hypothetical protein